MASSAGASADAIATLQRLEDEPWAFGYFQALRRLEALYPDSPGIGKSAHPSEDPFRICQEPVLHFSPSTLRAFEQGGGKKPHRLVSHFFGLFGPQSALPVHLTEEALERKLQKSDPTLTRFADIFHHRMASLLYRAWAEARPTVSIEKGQDAEFSSYVGSLIGVSGSAIRNHDDLPDEAKFYFAGSLSRQVRNADGLKDMLADYFGFATDVTEFVGGWMSLPGQCLMKLGETAETGCLGETTVLGANVWGAQQRFRITLGPMGLEELERMLPGGESLKRLKALVRLYAGDEKDWDVQLVLRREEVPATVLGKNGRLGWTSWMDKATRTTDAGDIILAPVGLAA